MIIIIQCIAIIYRLKMYRTFIGLRFAILKYYSRQINFIHKEQKN